MAASPLSSVRIYSCLTHSQDHMLTSKDLKFGELNYAQASKEQFLSPIQVTAPIFALTMI